jgi:chitin disaccharide deacetylase
MHPAPLVLCADDFALAPGVSRAIVDLVARGRLTATGCMTVSPFWSEHARMLDGLGEKADLGLHLTLTDHAPLGSMPRFAADGRFPANGRLILAAVSGRLAAREIAREIADEIARQIDAFEQARGHPPAFIDGHHHVHQLPVIRDAVIAAYETRIAPAGGYLRTCCEPRGEILRRKVAPLRATIIDALGRPFARELRERGIACNDSFRGVRSFSASEDTAQIFAAFVEGGGARPLAMCHPGFVDDALARLDPVKATRESEHAHLASDAFGELLERRGLRLARFDETRAP